MDVSILRGRASEAPIGWKHPSNGFLLLGSSIADDVAHDTKKGSIARAQEGISSSFAFAFALAFAFAYLRCVQCVPCLHCIFRTQCIQCRHGIQRVQCLQCIWFGLPDQIRSLELIKATRSTTEDSLPLSCPLPLSLFIYMYIYI